MKRNVPPAHDLKLSHEWLRHEFGVRGRFRTALRHATRCLDEIASYEPVFLSCKASSLACLERWDDLADLLEASLRRYPSDPEIRCELASLFAAHGDWNNCWKQLVKAERLRDVLADRNTLDAFYCQKLECLHAMGRTRAAIRLGQSVVKKNRRLTTTRICLEHLKNGTLRFEPWVSERAKYLPRLRRVSNRGHR